LLDRVLLALILGELLYTLRFVVRTHERLTAGPTQVTVRESTRIDTRRRYSRAVKTS
jgi:hypothetical protein